MVILIDHAEVHQLCLVWLNTLKASMELAQLNIMGWNPKPKHNSGWIQSYGRRLRHGLIWSVTLYGRCDTMGGGGTTDAEEDAGDSMGHLWMVLHIHMQGPRQ